MGLCSRRPTHVPLLTKRHRQIRLQWAREHRDWTMYEWKRVAYRMNPDFSFITSMVVSMYAVYQAKIDFFYELFFILVVAVGAIKNSDGNVERGIDTGSCKLFISDGWLMILGCICNVEEYETPTIGVLSFTICLASGKVIFTFILTAKNFFFKNLCRTRFS
ncbi:hypothetical protein AVEN_212582-1 [Araneus ventricosus]|uniref:Transposase Tc1-like domain-containing protein n=1 Tax=Araneus ventricosus TaxID=182803 RepID=A0A4Y2LN40_ARAVE|nr:hypothetical protein AVEN_212582-1 [Araneus ventricosus]